jgi:two-component system, NtrC family, sensor kinase
MMAHETDTRRDTLVRHEILSTASLLTGGLAHEINNALGALLEHLVSLSELVPPGSSGAARAELAGALEAAQHIAGVVRDVQGLLRADRRAAVIDPREPVARALRLAAPRAHDVATLHADLGDVRRVRGSDAWLTQIALNLILNGIEACRAGAPRSSRVDVSLQQQGDAVMLEVRDDGAGMEVEMAERIFRTIVSNKPGNGFGLAITCQLVADMAGIIEFDTQPGFGTCFRVRLPAAGNLP